MKSRIGIGCLGLALLAGCDIPGPFGSGHDAKSLIIFYGDTSKLVAPDTVVRGTDFTITFTSYGGGCYTGEVHDTVDRADHGVTIAAYDGVTGSNVCTDILRFIRHTVTSRVDAAGPATIYLVGEQRGGESGSKNAPAVLSRAVIVR